MALGSVSLLDQSDNVIQVLQTAAVHIRDPWQLVGQTSSVWIAHKIVAPRNNSQFASLGRLQYAWPKAYSVEIEEKPPPFFDVDRFAVRDGGFD